MKKYYRGYNEVKNKGKNVQDAHEAIRPTRANYSPESVKEFLTNDEYKLYSLIYARALSSLMSNALVEDQKLKIDNNGYIFEVGGERILFDGYMKIYGDYEGNDAKSLPAFTVGQILKNPEISSEQKFTSPATRYSES